MRNPPGAPRPSALLVVAEYVLRLTVGAFGGAIAYHELLWLGSPLAAAGGAVIGWTLQYAIGCLPRELGPLD